VSSRLAVKDGVMRATENVCHIRAS